MGERRIKKEYVLWLRIVAVVFALWLLIVWILFQGYERSQDIYLTAEQHALQSKVDATLKTYEVFSNYIFEEILANEEVLSLMYEANHANDEERAVLREEMYQLLKVDYDTISCYEFRQLHFHFPDTVSFLRMHRPDKYGDTLSEVRETVRIANEERIYVFGFEEGRIYNGYRFVYPLTYKDEAIGTVEVSLSMATLMEVLDDQYPYMDTYFLIDESVVSEKVFEDQLSNYIPANYFSDYLYDKEVYEVSLINNNLLENGQSFKLFDKVQKRFEAKKLTKESFSIIESINDKDYLLQFLAVDNVIGEKVGYFLAIQENTAIIIEKKDFLIQCTLVTLLMALFLVASFVYIRYQIRITEITMKDNLTGLYNRHKFNEVAENELQRCKRYGGKFSLLMVDIDYFKKVNDTYGHLKGDIVLKELATLLLDTVRVNDLVARWGGEEFICCLINTDEEQVKVVAEKIREAVESHYFTDVGYITVSVGGTLVTATDENLNGPIGRADDALYKSKHNGRNQYTII